MKCITLILMALLLTACVSKPPRDINNICSVFREHPRWYTEAKDIERRWKVPIAVQMAIVHQESKFVARAKPGRKKLLWIIPWQRPSTAYGYAQVLNGTWKQYKQTNGSFLSSRTDFGDGVDFIGWYANMAHVKAGIPRADAYSLYLAYHEGVGGYQRKTYMKKSWLRSVAHKVKARAALYSMQLNACRGKKHLGVY